MTSIDDFYWSKTELFFRAVGEFAPIVLFAFLLAIAVRLVAHYKRPGLRVSFVELVFFALVGVLIAYLVNLSQESVIAGLLPSFVVFLGFFFTLFVRATNEGKVPLGSSEKYLTAVLGICCFLAASRYFELLN